MIKRFASQAGSLDEDSQIGYNFFLTGEIIEFQRAEGLFYIAPSPDGRSPSWISKSLMIIQLVM